MPRLARRASAGAHDRLWRKRLRRCPGVVRPTGRGDSTLVILGLLLALASALATNVAFLLKHRVRSRWFAIGWMVAVGAWLLHVGALALAPLSIVQAVMAGGIVFLAVLSERYFGFHLGRWQWIGVTITGAGLAVIGFTGGGATRPQQSSLAAADRSRGRDRRRRRHAPGGLGPPQRPAPRRGAAARPWCRGAVRRL